MDYLNNNRVLDTKCGLRYVIYILTIIRFLLLVLGPPYQLQGFAECWFQ